MFQGKISRKYGAEIVERPVELASDMASSESAILHVINILEKKENYRPDIIGFLQCTSPLRQENDIRVNNIYNNSESQIYFIQGMPLLK